MLYPRVSALGDRIAIEPEMRNDELFVQQIFEQAGIPVSVLTQALDPSEAEQELAFQAARSVHEVIYFCFDPHLYPQSRQFLNRLEAQSENLKVVFLRDPFGADLLTRKTPYVCAFGFRSVQIQAAVELMVGSQVKGAV